MKRIISSLEKDFLASNLRSQLDLIKSLLSNVEETSCSERDYTVESLKRVKSLIRDLQVFLDD